MVCLNNPFEMERIKREHEERERREKEWLVSRFGEGPFDTITTALIEELRIQREEIRQLRSMTWGLQPF